MNPMAPARVNLSRSSTELLPLTMKTTGPHILAVYIDTQTDVSLTPLCAASLMGVFAQRPITGKIRAGFCPAGS